MRLRREAIYRAAPWAAKPPPLAMAMAMKRCVRVGPARDSMIIENTPVDWLHFPSPTAGLDSKLGIDATREWPSETLRI